MIYSKKYGRSFNSRRELQRYDWLVRRTRPILPWFGVRDAPYSEEYKRERRLEPQPTPWGLFVAWGVVVMLLLHFCVK